MTCKVTPEMAQEARQYDSAESFLRAGGFDVDTLDKAAFGFINGQIIEISPSNLKIKWKDDYLNVLWEIKHSGLSPKQWAKKISLEEPIDISYEKSKFFIEDGHHRYTAAKILKKSLTAKIEIKDRPIDILGAGMKYDDFVRCAWSQSKINEDQMNNSKIILTEQQILLFEDRKQFEALIQKRKSASKPTTDEDISNIEDVSGSDAYLVLAAKIYFNEIDSGFSPQTAKNALKIIFDMLRQHPQVSKMLPKQLFQYNTYSELRQDLKDTLTKIAAKVFYKKLPTKLKDEGEFEKYYVDIANIHLKLVEKNLEKLVLKKSAKLDRLLDFAEKLLSSGDDYVEIKNQYSSRYVDLVYENEEDQILLFAAKDEYGVDLLTENSAWCIREDYGVGYMDYRIDYSNNGSRTFCKLHNLLADQNDYLYFGFFVNRGTIANCYDANDDEASSALSNIIEEFDIDLSKIPNYTYYFEPEYEEEEPEEEEPEEELEDEEDYMLDFHHLAFLLQRRYNIHYYRDAAYFDGYHTPQDISSLGAKFVKFLQSNVKYVDDKLCSDGFFEIYIDDYARIIKQYFPAQTISTKQIIKFFEDYYGGFKFNYHYTGQDLFGDNSTIMDKEPINKFINGLIELELPINLNENKNVVGGFTLLENTSEPITLSKIKSDLEKLKADFARVAQEVYDGWEQDEDGHDEQFGYGGICDAIADAITEIIRSKTQYESFTNYDEYEFHTSTYVYHCYDEEMDENEFEKRAYMISVDIPYWMYESGAAYTWTKKQGVHFSADMVEITDMSSYAENFIDFENCEPI